MNGGKHFLKRQKNVLRYKDSKSDNIYPVFIAIGQTIQHADILSKFKDCNSTDALLYTYRYQYVYQLMGVFCDRLKFDSTAHRGQKGILKYFGFWDFLASDYVIVPN